MQLKPRQTFGGPPPIKTAAKRAKEDSSGVVRSASGDQGKNGAAGAATAVTKRVVESPEGSGSEDGPPQRKKQQAFVYGNYDRYYGYR